MLIGLYDVGGGKKFPNLALMKISSWHKACGDTVEFWFPLKHYDIVYVSKVFGDEYGKMTATAIRADKIIFGGTGFAITIKNGKEIYTKDNDSDLPFDIEHSCPDYTLYPQFKEAYGFLTRGCPNRCGFCAVWHKEGVISRKVADLSEFYRGQKAIKLLDPNILACPNKKDLLQQLAESGAAVDFTQGLDARFINEDIALMLSRIKTKNIHFAFDQMQNEKAIVRGLRIFKEICNPKERKCSVYILTNYDTSFEQDIYRVKKVQEIGLRPDIRIYRKNTAPPITKNLQRWSNGRQIYYTERDFLSYKPYESDSRTIKEIYNLEGLND